MKVSEKLYQLKRITFQIFLGMFIVKAKLLPFAQLSWMFKVNPHLTMPNKRLWILYKEKPTLNVTRTTWIAPKEFEGAKSSPHIDTVLKSFNNKKKLSNRTFKSNKQLTRLLRSWSKRCKRKMRLNKVKLRGLKAKPLLWDHQVKQLIKRNLKSHQVKRALSWPKLLRIQLIQVLKSEEY